MTGLLLESRAKRPRRAGGASLSVAIHVAIIGVAMAGTATGKPTPTILDPTVHLVPFLPPKPAVRDAQPPSAPRSPTLRQTIIAPPTIVLPPPTVPVGLPPIDLTPATSMDNILIGNPPAAGRGGPGDARGLLSDDVTNPRELIGTELLMRIVASRKPRYPESLRAAGIDGRVLVRFTVDTLGAVDMSSVKVLESTHDLFTRAVRDVLSSFRFKPAEVGGKRVTSLAEMPFEFSISR